MKLSTKSRYGVRAIIEIARNYGMKPVKRKDIVSRQNIPDSYLENILVVLRDSGLINTLRGVNGGYVLKKDPSDIILLDVITALQGPLSPVDCLDNARKCCRIDTCPTRDVWQELKEAQEGDVWQELKEAQEGVLKKYSIRDLLAKEPEGPDYSI